MIQKLLCGAAVVVLLLGNASAQEKKPDAKPDAVKSKVEGAKKVAKEEAGKDSPDAKKKALKEGAVKEGAKGEPAGVKGRVGKIAVENGVLKVSVEGSEYEFPVTENTFVALRSAERDGKQVVVGLQMFNANEGARNKEQVKKEGEKKEQPKKDAVKKADAKPADTAKEKKPE